MTSRSNDDIANLSVIQTYWRLYGGWGALISSPFLWLAFVVTLICYPVWLESVNGEITWAKNAMSLIPNLLAFSLGGMSIFLAFSNPALIDEIQEKGRADSTYMKTAATFFHFILVQVLALIITFLAEAHDFKILAFFSFLLTAYSLTTVMAVASNLLRLAQVFNFHKAKERDKSGS